MCAGKDTHSEKTWEDSKLSPSAIADPQGEQEVKAKSVMNDHQALKERWFAKTGRVFFLSFFFPPGL